MIVDKDVLRSNFDAEIYDPEIVLSAFVRI